MSIHPSLAIALIMSISMSLLSLFLLFFDRLLELLEPHLEEFHIGFRGKLNCFFRSLQSLLIFFKPEADLTQGIPGIR